MAMDFWYDAQLRRYFQQFVRIFHGFKYQNGHDEHGNPMFRIVPAKLAVKNRQVGHILRNNSENTMLSVPQITCDMSSMSIARERTQTPNHVSKVQVQELEYNPIDNKYMQTLGKSYTVERYMAVPYDVTMQVDIWTSNEYQKHQIMEQILVLFNPSIDLQTGTNPIDWTSLTVVELQDITWSSRGIQIGLDDEIEISTLSFKMPIWLSPPAKVKRQQIIKQIITNIGEMNTEFVDAANSGVNPEIFWGDTDLLTRIITTPGNHMIEVSGQEITLLGAHGDDGEVHEWAPLLDKYGKFRPGVSQIRLKTNANMDDHASDIVGTLEPHPTEPNKMLWVVDMASLPANTLKDINAIIDPHQTWPNDGKLPPASIGQRYLILGSGIGGNTHAWGNLTAGTDDIIQYDGEKWVVSFDASEAKDPQWVLNTKSNKQLKWTQDGWQMSLEGEYNPGFWRLFL